ncbi:hypothetical protein HYPSUDRAFT_1017605 [Hypholoma sublateritium FD-334 SS-4]|uniref:Uncharacterized protein n=1 Tax=Hypholoma sublateritium (strain FD-334 SS-4) TaxID=945553 RepID=A0A0D2KS03_HYPSF|nr:hypothetical protein HYPSUDRAFT_1017605 [Hypholoma sublateritium FD-334 SS-4]
MNALHSFAACCCLAPACAPGPASAGAREHWRGGALVASRSPAAGDAAHAPHSAAHSPRAHCPRGLPARPWRHLTPRFSG